MINNPVGIGIIISLLVLLSIVVIFFNYKSMNKEKKIWIITALLWMVFRGILTVLPVLRGPGLQAVPAGRGRA